MQCVVMPNFIMLSVIMQCVVTLSVAMLNVIAPLKALLNSKLLGSLAKSLMRFEIREYYNHF